MTMINLTNLNPFDRGTPESPEDGFDKEGAGQFDLLFSSLALTPKGSDETAAAAFAGDSAEENPGDTSESDKPLPLITGTATVIKKIQFEFDPNKAEPKVQVNSEEGKDTEFDSITFGPQEVFAPPIRVTDDFENVSPDSEPFDPVKAAKGFDFVLPRKFEAKESIAIEHTQTGPLPNELVNEMPVAHDHTADLFSSGTPQEMRSLKESDSDYEQVSANAEVPLDQVSANAEVPLDQVSANAEVPLDTVQETASIDVAQADVPLEVTQNPASPDTAKGPVPLDVTQNPVPNPFLRERIAPSTAAAYTVHPQNNVESSRQINVQAPETEANLESRPVRVDPDTVPVPPVPTSRSQVFNPSDPEIFVETVDYEPQVIKPEPQLPSDETGFPAADAPEPVKADPADPGFWAGPSFDKQRFLNSVPHLNRPRPEVIKEVKTEPGPVLTPPIGEMPVEVPAPGTKTFGTGRIQGIPFGVINNAKLEEHRYVRESNEFIETAETPAAAHTIVDELAGETPVEQQAVTAKDLPILKKPVEDNARITEAIFRKFAIDGDSKIENSKLETTAEFESVLEQVEKPVLEMSKTVIKNGEPAIFKFKLTPSELGSVEIRLEKNSQGELSLEFHAETEMASHHLRESFDHLKQKLEDAGFRVEDIKSFSQPASDQSFTQQHRGTQRENHQNPAAPQSPVTGESSENQDFPDRNGDDSPERLLSVMA